MAKYTGLGDYLRSSDKEKVSLSFSDMERLVGPLPKSAHNPKYSWWGNEESPRRGHAFAWLSAGYEAKADLEKRVVVFTRRARGSTVRQRIHVRRTDERRAKSRPRDGKLAALSRQYYSELDRRATEIADQLGKDRSVTRLLLDCIRDMYGAARSGSVLEVDDPLFEAAYHPPISSDLEFLVARVLYRYSRQQDLGWKILLRRQVGNTAPDIRVEHGGRTLAIVEVKAKAGWVQPIFSDDRYRKDMIKYGQGKGQDPEIIVTRFREQCSKYCSKFGLANDRVFILLPSLTLVHRKKSSHKAEYYERAFLRNSGLSKHSLILLSRNLLLNLSSNRILGEYKPTNRFEKFVQALRMLT